MCMYIAIWRASAPVSIFWLAMFWVGHCLTADAMPAFCASALIAEGVMSGEPTMYSLARLLLTVCRPFTPIAMATTPNAMRTAAATNPPISNALRMFPTPFRTCALLIQCPAEHCAGHQGGCGSEMRKSRKPDSGGGERLARTETGCDRSRDVEC